MRMDFGTKANLAGPANLADLADLATERIAIVALVTIARVVMAAFVISAHPKSAAAAALSHFT